MKLTILLALASVVHTQLIIQDQPNLIKSNKKQQQPLLDLTVSDFVKISDSLKDTFTQHRSAHSLGDAPPPPPHPPHHRPPPPPPHHSEPHAEQHGIVDFSDYTILEILDAAYKAPPHQHTPPAPPAVKYTWPWKKPAPAPTEPGELPLHKLGYLVSKSAEAREALGGESISLFAPTNWALTPPDKRGHHGKEHGKHGKGKKEEGRKGGETMEPSVPHPFHDAELAHALSSENDNVDEDEDRKARFSKIVGYILKYHTLDSVKSTHELSDSATVATTLRSSRDESAEPLRVRVAPSYMFWPVPHPTLSFNFYAKKVGYTVLAKNGIIHMISAPLLPPFSPLNQLFLFPQAFSTLTSGLQKTDLAQVVLPSTSVNDDSTAVGSMAEEVIAELMKETDGQFTIFSPTNFAFTRLGPKIVAFLHSPFPISKKVLKYVLAYHLVPDVIFHTDYNTISDEFKVGEEVDVDFPHPEAGHGPPPPPQHHKHHDREAYSSLWDMPHLPAKLPPPPKSWWPFKPSPPSPPPHHKPLHHHSGKANVTHYVLPTLLSTSGINKNATLKVNVYTYREGIKGHEGPLKRALVVMPHAKEEYGGTSEHGHEHEHKHEGPHPVRVWKADAVARNGAIHVVNTLLRPPYNYNHDKKEGQGMDAEIARLFAH